MTADRRAVLSELEHTQRDYDQLLVSLYVLEALRTDLKKKIACLVRELNSIPKEKQ